MLTRKDKFKIVDWITCDGQAKAIMEDGDIDWESTTDNEVEEFIVQCHQALETLLNINM